jgi:membrane-bound ClpP family serine protease
MRHLSGLIRLAPLALLALFVGSPAHAQAPQEDGVFVTVSNPITGPAINSQIKPAVEAAKNDRSRNVKKIIFDFNPSDKDAATEDYGPCSDLADYIRSLAQNGFTPIAFVHGKATRHTVLPILACEDIVMSSGAQIGEVWHRDRPVTQNQLNHYLTLAGVMRGGAVHKMIDKDVKLVTAQFKGQVIYVDPRRVEAKDPAYADVRITDPTPVPMPAGIQLYSNEHAQRFLKVRYQAESRTEVQEKFGLSPGSHAGDPLKGEAIRPVLIRITGTIDTPLRETVRRQIETAKARKENTFFFWIETGSHGDASAARNLADDIVTLGQDSNYPARTIAFIPDQVPELGIFLAFACQEIVMYLGTGAEASLGDFSGIVNQPPNQQRRGVPDIIRRNLVDLAEKTGHSKILVEGMFDKNLVIVRARNNATGERRLMTDAELQAQADKNWVREPGGPVKEKGVLLKLTATSAKNLRIAKTVPNKDVNEVYALYGVEADKVRSAEPSWLDNFAAFLRQTPVSILLVIVGIAGLVLELKAPGLVVPGVIAAVCFILFFWAQTQLGGQLIYLAIMLFILGLVLVGIEIFLIPGFGVTGVCGILLILSGLVLAGLDKAPESTADWVDMVYRLLQYGLTMAGAAVLAFLVARYLPKIPYANRLMLVPPEDKPEVEESSPLPGVEAAVSLLGQVGTATSMLRPSGMAKFGDRYIDVVTEGDFIPPGSSVQVVEVEGTRIVVKKV